MQVLHLVTRSHILYNRYLKKKKFSGCTGINFVHCNLRNERLLSCLEFLYIFVDSVDVKQLHDRIVLLRGEVWPDKTRKVNNYIFVC